ARAHAGGHAKPARLPGARGQRLALRGRHPHRHPSRAQRDARALGTRGGDVSAKKKVDKGSPFAVLKEMKAKLEKEVKEEPARTAEQIEADEVHAHLRALVEGAVRFEVEDDGRHVEGRRVDLPAETLRRLRRGVVPVDARIDLHGMHAGDARDAVEKFLREKR